MRKLLIFFLSKNNLNTYNFPSLDSATYESVTYSTQSNVALLILSQFCIFMMLWLVKQAYGPILLPPTWTYYGCVIHTLFRFLSILSFTFMVSSSNVMHLKSALKITILKTNKLSSFFIFLLSLPRLGRLICGHHWRTFTPLRWSMFMGI